MNKIDASVSASTTTTDKSTERGYTTIPTEEWSIDCRMATTTTWTCYMRYATSRREDIIAMDKWSGYGIHTTNRANWNQHSTSIINQMTTKNKRGRPIIDDASTKKIGRPKKYYTPEEALKGRRIAQRIWRAKNPEYAAKDKAWKEANREHLRAYIREYMKQWRRKKGNAEKQAANTKDWYRRLKEEGGPKYEAYKAKERIRSAKNRAAKKAESQSQSKLKSK